MPLRHARCGEGDCDDRLVRGQGSGRLFAAAAAAFCHGGGAVRRPRCGDQHHAAHPHRHGRRGHPPGTQPFGGRDRHRRHSGRRARHRHFQLPGRACGIFPLHDRPAARTGRGAYPGVRRRRRSDRGRRNRGAATVRRGAHLQPGRWPAARTARHDRRHASACRQAPARAGRPAGAGRIAHRCAEPRPRHHPSGRRRGRCGAAARPPCQGRGGARRGAGRHRHGRSGQEQPGG